MSKALLGVVAYFGQVGIALRADSPKLLGHLPEIETVKFSEAADPCGATGVKSLVSLLPKGLGRLDVPVFFAGVVRNPDPLWRGLGFACPGPNWVCSGRLGSSRPGIVVLGSDARWAVSDTLAHELGHVFGLPHLNSSNNCLDSQPADRMNLMNSGLESKVVPSTTRLSGLTLTEPQREVVMKFLSSWMKDT